MIVIIRLHRGDSLQ